MLAKKAIWDLKHRRRWHSENFVTVKVFSNIATNAIQDFLLLSEIMYRRNKIEKYMRTGTYSILKKITKVGKTKEIVSLKIK
jgi:hypothetical protein